MMPCFQSNKLRLFRAAAIQTAIHLARMAVFGAMVLQLGYFIVALAAFGYDAHANVHRKNPRQTSSLNLFLCGASPLSCSSMGDDRLVLRLPRDKVEPEPAAAPFSRLTQNGRQDVCDNLLIVIYIFIFAILYLWGGFFIGLRRTVARLKFIDSEGKSFMAAWLLSSLSLALVGLVASLL